MKTILIILGSSLIINILLKLLNNTNPEIFSFVNKVPKKWKGKWFIRWTILLILMSIVSVLVVIAGLSDIIGATIIGFSIVLTDLTFKKPKKIKE